MQKAATLDYIRHTANTCYWKTNDVAILELEEHVTAAWWNDNSPNDDDMLEQWEIALAQCYARHGVPWDQSKTPVPTNTADAARRLISHNRWLAMQSEPDPAVLLFSEEDELFPEPAHA